MIVIKTSKSALSSYKQSYKLNVEELLPKYGQEILALIDGNLNTRVIVTDIVQKVVFQYKEGNIISPDSSLVGKVIQVRFKSLH